LTFEASRSEYFEQLARRLKEMEDSAYADFAAHFGPRFRRYFRACGLGTTDSEDLASSCITDIELKVNRYSSPQDTLLVNATTLAHRDRKRRTGFEAWVFAVAHNFLVDWLRRQPKQGSTIELPDDLAMPPRSLDVPDGEAILALREAVLRLLPVDRQILEYRSLNPPQPFSLIADCLGLSTEAVRVRHFRALRRLRLLLDADAPNPDPPSHSRSQLGDAT
jgi:RNA polymerase sigma factor (sigma-70 family)